MFSHHQTHPQLDRGFRLGPATFLDLFVTALHSSSVAYQIPSNLGDSSSRVISFCISYCSWGSWGNNTGVTCYSLLQPTTFRRNSPLWPICLAWPCMAWLIVSLLHKPLCHSRAVIQEGDLNIMPRQTLISTSLENTSIFLLYMKELRNRSRSCFLSEDYLRVKEGKIESWV